MYAVNSTYHLTHNGMETVTKSDPLLLSIILCEKKLCHAQACKVQCKLEKLSQLKKKIGEGSRMHVREKFAITIFGEGRNVCRSCESFF